jgi:hypothetical protein
LAREHPETPEFAAYLCASLGSLADRYLAQRRFAQAHDRLRQAVRLGRKALASNPANPIYRKFLESHLISLAAAARGQGNFEEAAEAERELAKLRDSVPAVAALDARLAEVRKRQPPRDTRPACL